MFKAKKSVSTPIIPTLVDVEGINGRLNLVEAAFVTIRAGLLQFSSLRSELFDDPNILDLESMKGPYRLKTPRPPEFEKMSIVRASNGFAISKLVKATLVDLRLDLTVPLDGSCPDYYRTSFNEDFQCMPSKPVHLTGLDEIHKDQDAVVQVLAIERNIVQQSANSWVDWVESQGRIR